VCSGRIPEDAVSTATNVTASERNVNHNHGRRVSAARKPCMSNRSTTFAKRQRETQLKEKAKQKEERRAQRRTRVAPEAGGEDPDIAGIVPGPQPPQD
jgi:hypothetical protein